MLYSHLLWGMRESNAQGQQRVNKPVTQVTFQTYFASPTTKHIKNKLCTKNLFLLSADIPPCIPKDASTDKVKTKSFYSAQRKQLVHSSIHRAPGG